MRLVAFASALALAAFASAQQVNLPYCSLVCLESAISKTSCSLTDHYCQCTTGHLVIAASLGPCLCNSTCTPQDQIQVEDYTNSLCAEVLSSSKMTYATTSLPTNYCAEVATSTTGSGSVASATSAAASATSATASSASTGAANAGQAQGMGLEKYVMGGLAALGMIAL